jgi:hypothetical protein
VDLKTVQRAISDVAQALWQDRIDLDYAAELLQTWRVHRWRRGRQLMKVLGPLAFGRVALTGGGGGAVRVVALRELNGRESEEM